MLLAVESPLPASVIACPGLAEASAAFAGVPDSVPATTVNKVCGSGLKTVALAAQAIRAGDAEVLLAGGLESMSRAPYLLPKARTGYKMGNAELVDEMGFDDESVETVIDLVDQVHTLRRQLHQLGEAIGRQPAETREAIAVVLKDLRER